MGEIPENKCALDDNEGLGGWEFIADDGVTVLNRAYGTECNLKWLCAAFNVTGMYAPNVNLTCRKWKEWWDAYHPEDPPVDPEPEEPVQSGN